MKGLIGYGFWLVPPALLLASYILAFHRGRPVCLPVVCALLMPLMMACTVHGLTVQVLPWDGALLKTLWESGRTMTSGGAAAGVLAQALVQAVSVWGSTVVFVLAFLLMALGAFRLTILDVADWFFNRPQYEPQEIPERPSRTRPAPSRAAAPEHTSRRAAEIDIPVEDGPLVGKEPARRGPSGEEKGFFDRKPGSPPRTRCWPPPRPRSDSLSRSPLPLPPLRRSRSLFPSPPRLRSLISRSRRRTQPRPSCVSRSPPLRRSLCPLPLPSP